MDKKEFINMDKNFHIPLIISAYLVLDVILLFILCLIEIAGVNHNLLLVISLILEAIVTFIVALKGNIKSAIIYYILLLVSPAFLNVIAMSMIYFTDKLPFTPVVLLLFRTGYTVKGAMLSETIRLLLSFRLPALISIFISVIIRLIKGKKVSSLE